MLFVPSVLGWEWRDIFQSPQVIYGENGHTTAKDNRVSDNAEFSVLKDIESEANADNNAQLFLQHIGYSVVHFTTDKGNKYTMTIRDNGKFKISTGWTGSADLNAEVRMVQLEDAYSEAQAGNYISANIKGMKAIKVPFFDRINIVRRGLLG